MCSAQSAVSFSFLRMASSSLSMAEPEPAPELLPSEGSGRAFLPLSFVSSSSTALPDSSCLNRSSRLPEDCASGSSPCETSARVSSISTFSFMRSNAPVEPTLVISDSISFTCDVVLAVLALAISCSFSSLAEEILASRALTDSKSFSTLTVIVSICAARSLTLLTAVCRRVKASFASSSSPFSTAISARRYQSSAILSACSFWFCSLLCVASTSA
mmetsp:Transcript_13286/g.31520  ORF Transcript_13286/g.31520 Transcript_13286/m.31520 type:complete len:216 (+) Transcript_13286:223-870(+)